MHSGHSAIVFIDLLMTVKQENFHILVSEQFVWPRSSSCINNNRWETRKKQKTSNTKQSTPSTVVDEELLQRRKNSKGRHPRLAALHTWQSSQSSSCSQTAFWSSLKTDQLNMQILPYEHFSFPLGLYHLSEYNFKANSIKPRYVRGGVSPLTWNKIWQMIKEVIKILFDNSNYMYLAQG